MFYNLLTKVFKNIESSPVFTKKFSRRDFLKGVGLVFAFLSLSNVTNTLPVKTKLEPQNPSKGPAGYGGSGYGV